ncbi:MAG: hypothetical protein ACTSR8_14290 [Promethearchaeota archaeon]
MEDSDLNIKLDSETKRAGEKYFFLGTSYKENQPDGFNVISSKALDYSIKKLSHPNFLGSIHFNKEMMTYNMQSVENLMRGDLNMRLNKSLKNSMINPITKALILLMIAFNIIWLLYFYLF